jgi:hypothetical protein
MGGRLAGQNEVAAGGLDSLGDRLAGEQGVAEKQILSALAPSCCLLKRVTGIGV